MNNLFRNDSSSNASRLETTRLETTRLETTRLETTRLETMVTRTPRFYALSTCGAVVLAVSFGAWAGGCNIDQGAGIPTYGVAQSTTGASSTKAATTTAGGGPTTAGAGGGMQTAAYTLSLNNSAPQVDLADKAEVIVTIDPKGFSGPVTLSVDNLDAGAGVTAAFATPMVTLDGTTPATASLVLSTASSAPPTDVPITITGTSSGGSRSVNATLTIHSAITITIPQGVDALAGTKANPNTTAFGDYPTMITAPTGISAQKPVVVRFYNNDDVAHEVHADQGAQGFPHGQGDVAPHTMDTTPRKVTAAGTYDYYLHDETDPLNVGRIVIQ